MYKEIVRMLRPSFTQAWYNHECTQNIDIKNLKTLYIIIALQLKHKIVVVTCLNNLAVGERENMILSPPRSSLFCPGLIQLHPYHLRDPLESLIIAKFINSNV